jgi:hypothetical protein
VRRAIFTTIATAAAAAAAVTMGSAPAALADDGPTATSFTITTSGVLSLTTPASAPLGTANTTAHTLSAGLGDVVVADGTTPTDGAWTASVAISVPFTNGLTAPNLATIPNGNVQYDPVAACTNAGPGTGTFTAGTAAAFPDSAGTLTAMTAASLAGDTTCTWDPTITVTLDGSPAGHYTGTILHSLTGTG